MEQKTISWLWDPTTRPDKALAEQLDVTRSTVQKWMAEGLITLDGRPLTKNAHPKPGEIITVCIPDPVPSEVLPQAIPLDILYEDDDLLVVNKPKGMVVHPAAGHADGTLVNALLAHCGDSLSGIGGVTRPGIVHRIDKDTSGLLMVAKNDKAHQHLAAQIKEHSFTRVYETVVIGHLREEKGTVNAPIGRHPTDRKKMAITTKNSRSAVSHYEVLARYDGYDHVRVRLETGRTHQIRVHLSSLGHPVAGDTVYGPSKSTLGLQGQCLHARTVGFIHPTTGAYMEFTSDLPPYFTAFLAKLKGC
ncbi:MAG: RluA family pseudouridine synthase [Clostridia bacterium]|nr:RluA family pseudouridine synthase [Clostridia bacterium]